MSSSHLPDADPAPLDRDLVAQAQPGHGVPSQDPRAGAQVALSAEEAEREAQSAFMGGGVIAGAATGAVVGAAVAGPVGVLVGGTVGSVAGALGGAAVGVAVTVPTPDAAAADDDNAQSPQDKLPKA